MQVPCCFVSLTVRTPRNIVQSTSIVERRSAPLRQGVAVTFDDSRSLCSRSGRQLQREFVERWRQNGYNCFSSGHKFCREVCPVTQVTRNENHTPTAFHANIIAMDKGLLDIEDVADDYVHCTQCGACEIRCPNTLFVGDFIRPGPRR